MLRVRDRTEKKRHTVGAEAQTKGRHLGELLWGDVNLQKDTNNKPKTSLVDQ